MSTFQTKANISECLKAPKEADLCSKRRKRCYKVPAKRGETLKSLLCPNGLLFTACVNRQSWFSKTLNRLQETLRLLPLSL